MRSFPKSGATLLFAAAFLLRAASAQTTWLNTATQGISLAKLASAADLGPAPSDQAITVRVALNLQNKAALVNYVQQINDPSSSLYGQSLTPAQFAASYGATSAQVQQVASYLQGAGFTNVVAEPNNLLVSANGTVSEANAAFHTNIEMFNQFGAQVYGNTTVAQVPQALGSTVAAVLGLNTIGQMRPTLVTRNQASVPKHHRSG